VNETTILIILVLPLLATWNRYILVMNGAFLNGHFELQHKMYLEVEKPNRGLLLEQLYPATQTAEPHAKQMSLIKFI
jgi:hypothetical protein